MSYLYTEDRNVIRIASCVMFSFIEMILGSLLYVMIYIERDREHSSYPLICEN